jgi:molybdopterin-guanine dinucleotide biosynthesis protein
VSTDDSDHSNDKLLQLLQDNQIDLAVVEGLRLVVAFKKIKDPTDRRTLIELAERFAE